MGIIGEMVSSVRLSLSIGSYAFSISIRSPKDRWFTQVWNPVSAKIKGLGTKLRESLTG